jgi:uncharacterized membrane protein
MFGFGLWLWVAALFAAPVALRSFCAFICHQRPERSFFVHGVQLPVCARCTGLYVGAALAVPLALIAASSLPSRRARYALLLAALPTALTWTLEFAGAIPFSNTARAVAALPLGFAAAWLVLTVVADQ